MTQLVFLSIIAVVFIAGAVAGAILLVSLASVREDRRPLRRRPGNSVARAGRLVTGLRIEIPPAVPQQGRQLAAWRGETAARQRRIYN
jgi:hypothetical protein